VKYKERSNRELNMELNIKKCDKETLLKITQAIRKLDGYKQMKDSTILRKLINKELNINQKLCNKLRRCPSFNKDLPEELKLAAVNWNSYIIEYIKNPSEEIQLAAVKQDGWAIQYIENPSEEVQLAAVKQNDMIIQLIKNPSEQVRLAAQLIT